MTPPSAPRLAASLLLSLLSGNALTAQAPGPPPVNLYVADLSYRDGAIHIGTPGKLTGDRGISSQPSFTRDGKAILFVSRRDSANGQGDVYRINLASRKETRITATPEMENSPTVTPDGRLMVIRWTPATLFKEWGPWIYSMKGKPIKGVLPGPDTVGYYVSVDRHRFAMMRPKTRRAVAIFDTRTGSMIDYDWPVANLPPQLIPRQQAVSYTRVDSVGGNRLRRLDLVTFDTVEIAPALAGKSVHAWTPRGDVIMAKGNAIYSLDTRTRSWREIASFAADDLQDINAYVVSPRGDKLILISPLTPPNRK
ncbi:MAG: hypothetical protein ABIS03_09255 [Gemmatimonadaceae bacterium]